MTTPGTIRTDPSAGSDLSPRAVLLALLLALSLMYGNLAKESYTDDYRAFYLASVTTHDGLDPYVNQVNVSERYADALWLRADSRFIYPPTALFFTAPLRLLPYKWSKTAFGLGMTLTMVAILMALQRRFPRQNMLLLALFLTLPMFMNIDNGNCDILILGLALAAFYLEEGPLTGACLGVAIAIKLAPILLLVWFVANRRWRTVAWAIVVNVALGAAAVARWGTGYYREFFEHLRRHGDSSQPMLTHTFTTIQKIQNEVIVTSEGVFDYQHDIGGYMQNPLRWLGSWGGVAGMLLLLGFVVWLVASRCGLRLTPEQSFYLFLVVALLANPLLWAMGLVACFPLIALLVEQSKRPSRTMVLLLVPFALTKQVIGEGNFLLWLACAGYCVWQSGWLQSRSAPAISEPATLSEA